MFRTLIGRPIWLALAICLSMVALLLTGCGSDSPATETSTAIVPATGGGN